MSEADDAAIAGFLDAARELVEGTGTDAAAAFAFLGVPAPEWARKRVIIAEEAHGQEALDGLMGIERRVVEVPLSPPRRLLAPTRWRSFKTVQDHAVWEQAWSRVQALVDDGWTVERVVVDWGRRVPGIGEQREALAARLFPGVPVAHQMSPGDLRGTTYVHLRR